ncbi:hypothetical protein QOV31_002594 [Agrobacterium fabrum]|nr:hypothetical protein QOV31_002594 [Agrobacterium fabrum]CAD0209539.1 hypothetical protein AGTUEHA105_LOCUS2332 [Agrobacterium tumefaciens]
MVTNFYLCFYGVSLSAELWQQVRSRLLLAHCCLKPVETLPMAQGLQFCCLRLTLL